MSRRPRPGEIQPGFEQADKLVRTATLLGHHINAYTELLSADSTAALKEIKSPVIDTPLEEQWPLVTNYPDLVRAKIQSRLQEPLGRGIRTSGDMKTLNDASLGHHAYYASASALSEVYGQNPRLGFARDLAGWTTAMDRSGWPIVAGLELNEERLVGVSVYKDTEEMRDLLDRWVAAPVTEDHLPHRWLSHKVIAVGELAELNQLDSQIPAQS